MYSLCKPMLVFSFLLVCVIAVNSEILMLAARVVFAYCPFEQLRTKSEYLHVNLMYLQ
jgi:hypothetical protein